jgi:hypothetical protein
MINKKQKSFNFFLEDKVYRQDLRIIVSNDFNYINKFFKKYKVYTDGKLKELKKDENSEGLFIIDDDGYYYILINKFENSSNDVGTLSHELLHYAMQVIYYKNIFYFEESNEHALIYFHEWALKEALDKVLKLIE